MGKKFERTMAAEPRRRGGVSSSELVALIREGRLTRRAFDSWRTQRRPPGKGFVIAMPDTPPASSKRAARRRHKKG